MTMNSSARMIETHYVRHVAHAVRLRCEHGNLTSTKDGNRTTQTVSEYSDTVSQGII